MKEYTVNRKQFHFLLSKFLAEHRLQERWFNDSKSFKMRDDSRWNTYDKYGISSCDTYSEHLSKCIDLYIGETCTPYCTLYSKSIYGFFRFIPSGGCDGGDNWATFWKRYSDIWEDKTRYIYYEDDKGNG